MKPWHSRALLLASLALWCWLPCRYLMPLIERYCVDPSGWQFTDSLWEVLTELWLVGLGLLVWRLQRQAREHFHWLAVVAVAACWIIVLGGALNLALRALFTGGAVGLTFARPAAAMLLCGLGLLWAGVRPVGWTVLAFGPLAAWILYAVGSDPASGQRALGWQWLVWLSCASLVAAAAWQWYCRRHPQPVRRWAIVPLAALLIAAAAVQAGPMLSLAAMGCFADHDGLSILSPVRYADKDFWPQCPLLVERRPDDPLAWGLYANWIEVHRDWYYEPRNADLNALARCWLLSGELHGKLRDCAGVRLVEEGVYPTAVEQARRELALD